MQTNPFPRLLGRETAKLVRIPFNALEEGLAYLRIHAFNRFGLPLWILALCGMGATFFRALTGVTFSGPETIVALFLVVQMAFVVLAGGDWMEAGRFIVHVMPVVAILALTFLARVAPRKALVPVGLVLIGFNLGGTLNLARYGSTGRPIWTVSSSASGAESFSWFEYANRTHQRDIPFI